MSTRTLNPKKRCCTYALCPLNKRRHLLDMTQDAKAPRLPTSPTSPKSPTSRALNGATNGEMTQHDRDHSVNLTKKVHKAPYPSLSPLRPELSQKGRTVLIAGASSGIGYAIARAFGSACASRIILLGRRPQALKHARNALYAELRPTNPSIVIDARGCDIVETEEARVLWEGLKREGIRVDVLVLNAAAMGASETILGAGVESVWRDYVTNVRAVMDFTERFYKQDTGGRTKYLVNVSSSASHRWFDHAQDRPSYGLTKNSAALLLQQIAKDTPAVDMQIVSFHPGGVLTEAAREKGFTEESWSWDHEDLPGQFAVWAASEEASFFHGRFAWARWDVDELKSGPLRDRIDADPYFLKVGVVGAQP